MSNPALCLRPVPNELKCDLRKLRIPTLGYGTQMVAGLLLFSGASEPLPSDSITEVSAVSSQTVSKGGRKGGGRAHGMRMEKVCRFWLLTISSNLAACHPGSVLCTWNSR